MNDYNFSPIASNDKIDLIKDASSRLKICPLQAFLIVETQRVERKWKD